MRRILVTGSRDLDDWPLMYGDLRAQALLAGGSQFLTVIHGGASGADSLAAKFCQTFPEVTEERVDADWGRDCDDNCYHKPRFRKSGDRYCPLAGHLRNQEMVDRDADACLAYPRGEARGTNDCIRRAIIG